MRFATSRTAVVATLLVALAACGGGNKSKTTSSSLSTSTTEKSTTSTTPVTTYGALGSSTTKVGSAGAASATTSKPTQANGAPAPAAAGTYDYSQTGTSSLGPVSPNAAIKADPADSAGVQVWHIASNASEPADNDETIAFGRNGPFLTDLVLRAGSQTITCHFDGNGVPTPPWPADTGKPISGHANCGQVTVDIAGSVTGHHTATVAGQSINVVDTHFTITTHGQIESTATSDASWAPSLRMITHDHTAMHGRFGAIAFQSDTTRDLLRPTPR